MNIVGKCRFPKNVMRIASTVQMRCIDCHTRLKLQGLLFLHLQLIDGMYTYFVINFIGI